MLDKIETQIFHELQKFSKQYFDPKNKFRTGPYITTRINEIIAAIGRKERFEICLKNKSGEYHSEWLYDIVWYKNNHIGQLETIELVAESELIYGIKAI